MCQGDFLGAPARGLVTKWGSPMNTALSSCFHVDPTPLPGAHLIVDGVVFIGTCWGPAFNRQLENLLCAAG